MSDGNISGCDTAPEKPGDPAEIPPEVRLERFLRSAAEEIRRMRNTIEVLGAKVDTFEKCAMMTGSRPPPILQQGYGEDMAWRLEQEADILAGKPPVVLKGRGLNER